MAVSNLVKGSWKQHWTLGNSVQRRRPFPFWTSGCKSSHFVGLCGISHYDGEKQGRVTQKRSKLLLCNQGHAKCTIGRETDRQRPIFSHRYKARNWERGKDTFKRNSGFYLHPAPPRDNQHFHISLNVWRMKASTGLQQGFLSPRLLSASHRLMFDLQWRQNLFNMCMTWIRIAAHWLSSHDYV